MIKTERTLRYRPRSLSISYSEEQCQHPKLRPLDLQEAKNLLRNHRTLLKQEEVEAPLYDRPKIPEPDGEDEERKAEILGDITAR